MNPNRFRRRLAFRPEYRTWRRRTMWALVTLGLLAPLAFVGYVIWTMPSLRSLENPDTDLSSQVYTADKVLLGSYYGAENRINIRYADLPKHLQQALVSTEDVRFYDHSGIDPKFVFAAPFMLLSGDIRGGSTITQQLARNLYNEAVGFDRSLIRKIKEAIVAAYLERRFTKNEILTMYLNTVPFGGTVYGVQAASKAYFGKDVNELSVAEGAVLVGMLQATTRFNPILNPDASKGRRNIVLSQMVKYGFLPRAEFAKLRDEPIRVVATTIGTEHSDGLAPHFRSELYKWLRAWCERKGIDMHTSGLRVYTTLNSRLQRHAETAVNDHMRELQKLFERQLAGREPWKKDKSILERAYRQSARYNTMKNAGASEAEIRRAFQKKIPMRLFAWNDPGYVEREVSPWDSLAYYAEFLQPGFVVIDPHTGHVLAWVGGLDHRFFKYDHVKQSKRQVGSTFKPFVYTAAFDNGYSPCHEVLNMPTSINNNGQIYSPRNADRNIGGTYTLRKGLALSLNTVTLQVMKNVGPQVVADYAKRMGVVSKLDVVPSLALGTSDLTVLELTSAYATFADKGRWHEPIFVTRIEDKFGNVLEEFRSDSREALSEQTAYLMVDMLRGVVNEGTAASLRWRYNIPQGVDMGGKTGTSQNHADGWFVGITPQFAGGVWVGASDRSVSFPTLEYGQGGRMALPIWGKFAKLAYEDEALGLPKTFFERPENLTVEIDCKKYRETQRENADDNGAQVRPQEIDF